MLLIAVLIHVTGVEIVDSFGFDALLPFIDQETLIRFDAPDKIGVAIGESWAEVPAKDVGRLLLLRFAVAIFLRDCGYRMVVEGSGYEMTGWFGDLIMKLEHPGLDEAFERQLDRHRHCTAH